MAVIGAILGDISESQYGLYGLERPENLDYKHCELFTDQCCFTDDTVLTLAVKSEIRKNFHFAGSFPFESPFIELAVKYSNEIHNGKYYWNWLSNIDNVAYKSFVVNGGPIRTSIIGLYNSLGNGAARRCSYIGEHFNTEKEVVEWAKQMAKGTRNHPEGIKDAIVTAMCVFMARTGASKEEIFNYTAKNYPKSNYRYSVEYRLNEYRDCKYTMWLGRVPAAVRCFLESEDYESFLRNVYSLPWEMNTLCAIGGGIAEEFYHGTGFDEDKLLKKYLDETLYEIVKI